MFRRNPGSLSRIGNLERKFDHQLEILERVGVPMKIAKEFHEMRYGLRDRMKKFAEVHDREVHGFFPVIPFDEMTADDLMTFIRSEKGAGIVRLPSPVITDSVQTHFRPYLAINPRITLKKFGPGRRFATAQEIISYAVINGLTEADLIARSSECGGACVCLRLNEDRPEIAVSQDGHGELLSLAQGFIL